MSVKRRTKPFGKTQSHLRRFLMLGLSCLFSLGLILSGLGGMHETSELPNSTQKPAILGAEENKQIKNQNPCPKDKPVLGLTNKDSSKEIANSLTANTLSYTCYTAESDAQDNGFIKV